VLAERNFALNFFSVLVSLFKVQARPLWFKVENLYL